VRRWIWGTVALVVAVVGGVGAYVVYRHHEEAKSLTSTNAGACKAANAEARKMTGPFTFGSKRVVVLGDSYAVGTTLSDPQHQAWDVLLARREKWNLTVHGIGRTGFVNGGYCGNQSYPNRVRQLLADHPQMIIVEGGNNDAGQSGIGAAARAVLAKIPATIRVVVVGPTDAPGRDSSDQRTTDRELAAAAGKRYISPLRWKLKYGPDHIHMTAAGNRILADHLAAALAALPPAGGNG
jgi:lysophospholipase L1-like esterase